MYERLADEAFAMSGGSRVLVSENRIMALAKARDELVKRTERYMLFLASVLIVIFLVINELIQVPKIFGIEFNSNGPGDGTATAMRIDGHILFAFGFLLIGNLIALLHSGAMLKLFLAESLLQRSLKITHEGRDRVLALVALAFFPYIYRVIDETIDLHSDRSLRALNRFCHVATIVSVPFTYIGFYLLVLLQGLWMMWQHESIVVSVGFVAVLLLANAVTLTLHAYTFLPRVVREER